MNHYGRRLATIMADTHHYETWKLECHELG